MGMQKGRIFNLTGTTSNFVSFTINSQTGDRYEARQTGKV
jgi:hypothetical protein